jgi:hypothetical protein
MVGFRGLQFIDGGGSPAAQPAREVNSQLAAGPIVYSRRFLR